MKVLILTRYGNQGASSRVRFFQFLPLLSEANIEYAISPFLNNSQLFYKYDTGSYNFIGLVKSYWRRIDILLKANKFDLIWIEKEALPWFPSWLEIFFLSKTPYILDYDDAVFHGYDMHQSRFLRFFYGKRLDQLMTSACLVVAGNNYLADRARHAGARSIAKLPTVVDLNRYVFPSPFLKESMVDGVRRVVWIGSSSTVQYLKMLYLPLKELARRERFILRVIGPDRFELPEIDCEWVPWSEESEVCNISSCDIGIMPLLDGPWERGKCGYKIIQYMACGLPVIASDVGVNGEIVKGGVNGFLARNDEEWISTLSYLLKQKSLRVSMGEMGRKDVEEKFCIQKIGSEIINLLTANMKAH